MFKAAKITMPFSSPYTHSKILKPGWTQHVSSFKSDAIDWHRLWVQSGCPPHGYVFEMRKATVLRTTNKLDLLNVIEI